MTETENEKAAPRVERLEDLVAYQDGSVVSREIIQQEHGNGYHLRLRHRPGAERAYCPL